MVLVLVAVVGAFGAVAALLLSALCYGLAHWLGAPGAWAAAALLATASLGVALLLVSTLRGAQGADAHAVARLFAVGYAAPLLVTVPTLVYFLWRAAGRW